MATITAGSTVYDIDGREAEYVSQLSDGKYAVYPLMAVYSGDDEEVVKGKIAVWEGPIFTSPPMEKVNGDVEAAQAKLNELIAQQNEVTESIREQENAGKVLIERLKRYKALEHIDKILANEITHYAQNWYGTVEIVELEKTKSQYGPSWQEKKAFGNDLRLLSLFGSYEGDLTWKLNEYRDGSGGWCEVVPCFSLEHAKDEAVNLMVQYATKLLDRIATSDNKDYSENHLNDTCNQLCKRAEKMEIDSKLPDWIKERAKANEVKSKAKKIADLKAAADKAVADYQKAISE